MGRVGGAPQCLPTATCGVLVTTQLAPFFPEKLVARYLYIRSSTLSRPDPRYMQTKQISIFAVSIFVNGARVLARCGGHLWQPRCVQHDPPRGRRHRPLRREQPRVSVACPPRFRRTRVLRYANTGTSSLHAHEEVLLEVRGVVLYHCTFFNMKSFSLSSDFA